MSADLAEKNRIPERLLARLWQKRAARQEWLRTQGGTRVRVIYPGSVGTGAGPDFRNALLDVEGQGIVRGDVEIHVRQKDWKSHGHGGDPNYNGVVLHAALEVDSQDTQLQSGRRAPVVSLMPLLASEGSGDHGTGTPGSLARGVGVNAGLWGVLGQCGYPAPNGPDEMGELLDLAGDHRFLAQSGYYSALLREQSPEQTLYENLMEGLGYRYNQQPFLKLAARAPYAALERAARRLPRECRAQVLGSWLMGLSGLTSAGLICSEPQGYRTLPRVGFGAPLFSKEWHCFRLRPSNHPRRRIMGAAVLLDRFLDQGLVAGLAGACGAGRAKELLTALTAPGEVEGQPALIGKDRAGDLAVNVVLPFFHALNGLPGNAPSGDSLAFYRGFGKLQDNELLREMTGQLLDPAWTGGVPSKLVNSARRQQGLLRLHAVLTGAS